MKLVITGALGHIGSQFIHSLKPHAYEEVLLLDNLSTQRYCSLFRLPAGIPFRFVEQDICTADLKSLCSGMDAVVHLAAITNAAESFEIQEQVPDSNGHAQPFHVRVTAPSAAAPYRTLIEQMISEQKPAYATAELQFRTPDHAER